MGTTYYDKITGDLPPSERKVYLEETALLYFKYRHEVSSEGCWLWKPPRHKNGYASAWVNGRRQLAHRLSYELHKGPIPDGLSIDHLCRVRHCVNPKHLEAVTPGENGRRGVGWAGINSRKTHCVFGHEFNKENTYYNLGRRCRKCVRARNHAFSGMKRLSKGLRPTPLNIKGAIALRDWRLLDKLYIIELQQL